MPVTGARLLLRVSIFGLCRRSREIDKSCHSAATVQLLAHCPVPFPVVRELAVSALKARSASAAVRGLGSAGVPPAVAWASYPRSEELLAVRAGKHCSAPCTGRSGILKQTVQIL